MGDTTPAGEERRHLFTEPDGFDATWVHRGARQGFETAWLRRQGDGHRLVGRTCAIEDGVAWAVGYNINVDNQWRTLRADLTETVAGRDTNRVIETDGAGRWTIDGVETPSVDGCFDIDLESSALTNTIFLHRVQPSTDDLYDAPAVFVRCAPLRLERVEQTYQRTAADTANPDDVSFAYKAPAYDTDIELRFDQNGLVLDYPGLAVRFS